jgi:GNAT superfamily N-acetyltransferase/nitroimidazol reductase NimA-like FMN-containing flavoprotein (pyridoxamine 5'-phosphate oxidase superfamily)
MATPMRRKERQADEALGYEILAQAEVVYLAAHTTSGALVLRALNAVVVDDWLLFHSSHAGEKTELLGEALVSAHRVIAEIPSYFVDPELACPATTYYESVEARGQLVLVQDPTLKDAMLMALMRKYQPEGGFRKIDSSTELYKKQVLATRVFGFRLKSVVAKRSLGQDRPTERVQKVVTGLWKRGNPRDLLAIEPILKASPNARPEFLRGPSGSLVVVHPSGPLALAHAELLEGEYWRRTSTREQIATSIVNSAAWIGLTSAQGELLAAGRAVTDDAWTGVISDVVVHRAERSQGYGQAIMRLLLDHPRVRGVKRLRLGTRDAMAFYERFGFKSPHEEPLPFSHTEMVRVLPANG